MDIKKLKHDPSKIHSNWVETVDGEGNSLIATRGGCKIYFPKHYTEGKLGSIDTNFNVIAIFCVVVDDKYYSVSDAIAEMTLSPDEVNVVKVDDAEYYELVFEDGSVITINSMLVVDNQKVYQVFDEFLAKGKTPWYISYTMLLQIFKTARIHAGVNLGVDAAVLSMMTASRGRQQSDKSKYYRNQLATQRDLDEIRPAMLPLTSVASATNTTSKIMGSYLTAGIVSSLVSPSTQTENIEQLLLS